MHQMHFIYLVVLWNDCHEDMNPDIFCCTCYRISCYTNVSFYYNCNSYFFYLNSFHNCFFTLQVQYPAVYALYGNEECLINTNINTIYVSVLCLQTKWHWICDTSSEVQVMHLKHLVMLTFNLWNKTLKSTKTHSSDSFSLRINYFNCMAVVSLSCPALIINISGHFTCRQCALPAAIRPLVNNEVWKACKKVVLAYWE